MASKSRFRVASSNITWRHSQRTTSSSHNASDDKIDTLSAKQKSTSGRRERWYTEPVPRGGGDGRIWGAKNLVRNEDRSAVPRPSNIDQRRLEYGNLSPREDATRVRAQLKREQRPEHSQRKNHKEASSLSRPGKRGQYVHQILLRVLVWSSYLQPVYACSPNLAK